MLISSAVDALLESILQREGSKDTNNPHDAGGRTKFGIAERFHPEAWVNGPPTREQAKGIFFQQYFIQPGIYLVEPDYLRNQLADFAVHSGPATAVMQFQKLLGVTMDGHIGPGTLGALKTRDVSLVNNQLAVNRALMLARLVQKRPTDLEFLYGWLNRALSFARLSQ